MFYDRNPFLALQLGGFGTAGTNTGIALNSNYVFGSAGACVGVRFLAPFGGVHLHTAYFFLHAADAVGCDLACNLANYGSLVTVPGSSIRQVTTPGGTTANKWVKFDFSAFSDVLTPGAPYWGVVGNPQGATNSGYQIRGRNSAHNLLTTPFGFSIYSSTNGFTTAGPSITLPVAAIFVFSDGSVIGYPYTTALSGATTSLEHGLLISGLTEKLSINGLAFASGSSSYFSSIQVYEGSTAAGGTVWAGFNGGAAYNLTTQMSIYGVVKLPQFTFDKNTIYRVTMKNTNINSVCGYNCVEDPTTPGADALAACLGQGNFCYTIDNGAGGWTDYNDPYVGLYLPRMSLMIQDQVAVAAGGNIFCFID